jgi:hypothetical protein
MTKPKKKARTDMRIYMQIFNLKFDRHLSNRQIALTLNIGRSTVNDLIVRFGHLGHPWPLPENVSTDVSGQSALNYPNIAKSDVKKLPANLAFQFNGVRSSTCEAG